MKFKTFLFLGFFILGGCAWFSPKANEPFPPPIEIDEQILEATEESLEKSYDPLTLIQRAEVYFRKKEYIEASGEYKRFLELHPLHRFADYVQFKLGMSYSHQVRSIDQDQEPLQKALLSFQTLIANYPDSPYVDPGQEKIRYFRDRLAHYQLYVGRFYFKKKSYPGAIERFQGILVEYDDTSAVMDALYYLGLSFESSGVSEKALRIFQELITRFPDGPHNEEIIEHIKLLAPDQHLDGHGVSPGITEG